MIKQSRLKDGRWITVDYYKARRRKAIIRQAIEIAFVALIGGCFIAMLWLTP